MDWNDTKALESYANQIMLARIYQKGNGITKDEVKNDGNIQCIRYGEIYSKYDSSISECFSKTNKELIPSPKYISKGDILFAGTGELVEEIGKNVVIWEMMIV